MFNPACRTLCESRYSTPRVPDNHARYIQRRVDASPHQVADEAEEEDP